MGLEILPELVEIAENVSGAKSASCRYYIGGANRLLG